MPIGKYWHFPANISVIYYMCNVKVKNININKNNKKSLVFKKN